MKVFFMANSLNLVLLRPSFPHFQCLCHPLFLRPTSYPRPRFKTRFYANYPSQNMDSQTTQSQILHEFRFFRVHKNGHIEKFQSTEKTPPFDDKITGVQSKDVVVSSGPAISARIFLPKIQDPTRKLPVLLYVHGGGFCFESAFSPKLHNYVTTLSSEADVIAVSVEYRLAPEHPIPACYEDSWGALQWVASHAKRNGPEAWLNEHADLDRVFVAGDSAGGNISHYLASRVGSDGLPGVKLVGAVLVHPYFGGTDDDKMWLYMYPENGGLQDPKLKPAVEDLARLGCERVLVFVAQKDHLREVGWSYYEELKKSGWGGNVEIVENEGEEHCFHIEDLSYVKAQALIKRYVSFLKEED